MYIPTVPNCQVSPRVLKTTDRYLWVHLYTTLFFIFLRNFMSIFLGTILFFTHDSVVIFFHSFNHIFYKKFFRYNILYNLTFLRNYNNKFQDKNLLFF